jgi:hypothetical protein
MFTEFCEGRLSILVAVRSRRRDHRDGGLREALDCRHHAAAVTLDVALALALGETFEQINVTEDTTALETGSASSGQVLER